MISSHYKEDIDILCDVVYEVKKGMLKKSDKKKCIVRSDEYRKSITDIF